MTEELAHLQLAEKRLCDAASKLGMNPQSAGISAFFNSLLLSCRIDALIEYTKPFELDSEGNPILKGTYEDLLLKHIEKAAEKFESMAAQPRLVAANGMGLNS